MPSIYFLVILLALLPLSTLATADQDGGVAILNDQALTDRFCLRGRRSRIQTPPPSRSTEKYLEKTSMQADAAMQETGDDEEEEEGKVGMKYSKETRFEDEAADDAKMSGEKKKEANKYYKPAAAAATSPFKPKGSNNSDVENMN